MLKQTVILPGVSSHPFKKARLLERLLTGTPAQALTIHNIYSIYFNSGTEFSLVDGGNHEVD